MKYTLIEHSAHKPTSLDCKYFLPKEAFADKIDVLVISFFGVYPDGSLGKDHAKYISKKAICGIIDFNPDVIVLDFRGLTYRWGNSLLRVFDDISMFKDGGNDEGEANFPILVVSSSTCKDGLQSLLTPASSTSVPDYLFEDIDIAIKTAAERGKYWLDH
ncbi:hypothetical protein MC378_08125 [Polaribacter sp. MSW13]|uniref:Uncharacterized protein n=1 Tax=Polaribacter marinus TaxID=2916838 RepID=A0A9X1VN63_9FLAO|nr:hypothetical protein [Polaribacter marinus]MCI2229130.1 hypothetical protein [Polaribacter marinus]